MNSNPNFHENVDINPRGTPNPLMIKLASMRPSFPTDPSSLSMFDIPQDPYYSSITSQQTKTSNMSLRFDIYNSFDIYGNELEVNNERINQLYEDNDVDKAIEENNFNGRIKINKENTNPRTLVVTPMKMGRNGFDREVRSPLLNITPSVPLKKSGEKNDCKIEVKMTFIINLCLLREFYCIIWVQGTRTREEGKKIRSQKD